MCVYREDKAACEIVKNTHSITMDTYGYVRHLRSGRMMSWLQEASETKEEIMHIVGFNVSKKESSQSISQF